MKNLRLIVPWIFLLKWTTGSDLAADFIYNPVHVEDENLDIVKRQANTKAPPTRDDYDYTSVVTSGGCKLYVKEVIFLRKDLRKDGQGFETIEVSINGSGLQSADGTCKNATTNGTITLNYVGNFYPKAGGHDSLTQLKLSFDISYSKPFGWWEVTELDVDATGSLLKDRAFHYNFNKTVLKSLAMGASKKFSYACGETPTLFYSTGKEQPIVYGIKFRHLQIQPFEWSRHPGNFTDNVDDCIGFFTAGIWMFLIVASVLMVIVFFGIAMIGNLKSMDRFDDPKGKPLVISAKE